MEWQTSEPPVGREIEFEDGSGEVRRGTLQHFVKTARDGAQVDLAPAYTIPGNANAFTVKHWREIG